MASTVRTTVGAAQTKKCRRSVDKSCLGLTTERAGDDMGSSCGANCHGPLRKGFQPAADKYRSPFCGLGERMVLLGARLGANSAAKLSVPTIAIRHATGQHAHRAKRIDCAGCSNRGRCSIDRWLAQPRCER